MRRRSLLAHASTILACAAVCLLALTAPAGGADRSSSIADLERRISELTGLDEAAAARAAQREYGEPVQWQGSEAERAAFSARLQAHGAQVLRGGRFLHVSGPCDKGQALLWLNGQYATCGEDPQPLSIAVGDSENDIAMLEAADYALRIRSPVHPPPRLTRTQRVFTSQDAGPAGWDEGVRHIVNTIKTTRG